MKKTFTLFLMAFIATAMFAQQAVLTELWHESRRSGATYDEGLEEWTESLPPEWMGPSMWGPTERGLAAIGDKLYVPSRKNGNEIIVLDAADGSVLATIVLPDVDTADPENGIDSVAGGIYDINSISTTESGDLILGNLATNTQSHDFMAYQITLDAAGTNYTGVKRFISWNNIGDTENPALRLGDGIEFWGDIADGKIGYVVVAGASSNYILKWNVTNGVADANPVIYQVADVEGSPVNFDVSPQCDGINETMVIVDGKGMFPIAYDMASTDPAALETVASFGVTGPTQGHVTPQTNNLNGVDYFEFKGRYFMACVTNFWQIVEAADGSDSIPYPNSYEVFEFADGDWGQATSLGLVPSEGLTALTSSKNASFVYPVKVVVEAERAVIYVMSSPLGIAAYELTITTTAIGDTPADKVTLYPNPADNVVNFSTEMTTVQLFDISGKLVKEAFNVTQLNVSDLSGVFIVKAVDKNGNSVYEKLFVK